MSVHLFTVRLLDIGAISAMAGIGLVRAMKLFTEIEKKADNVRKPRDYLSTAARRAGFGSPSPGPP